jgi:predicted solute-binding protein
MLARPAPWRGAMEVDRLTEAIQLRERVNQHYLTDSVHELKTRTLRSLIDEIRQQQQKAS